MAIKNTQSKTRKDLDFSKIRTPEDAQDAIAGYIKTSLSVVKRGDSEDLYGAAIGIAYDLKDLRRRRAGPRHTLDLTSYVLGAMELIETAVGTIRRRDGEALYATAMGIADNLKDLRRKHAGPRHTLDLTSYLLGGMESVEELTLRAAARQANSSKIEAIPGSPAAAEILSAISLKNETIKKPSQLEKILTEIGLLENKTGNPSAPSLGPTHKGSVILDALYPGWHAHGSLHLSRGGSTATAEGPLSPQAKQFPVSRVLAL